MASPVNILGSISTDWCDSAIKARNSFFSRTLISLISPMYSDTYWNTLWNTIWNTLCPCDCLFILFWLYINCILWINSLKYRTLPCLTFYINDTLMCGLEWYCIDWFVSLTRWALCQRPSEVWLPIVLESHGYVLYLVTMVTCFTLCRTVEHRIHLN